MKACQTERAGMRRKRSSVERKCMHQKKERITVLNFFGRTFLTFKFCIIKANIIIEAAARWEVLLDEY